ncbi:MAG: fumarylacetoacetate hydrolase family protein [Candidatus Neomarinimicrobiota bacterium]|mgnify:CR=1 FL=1|jgi:fumarylpyruvate hydrolase|uniref:Fumarylacetoacetase-like C-terminal domain-containing protein n=1 Tax=marine metagenome TaxID=408172 RepID=A0A382MMF4_9ZZZZ|nr:fumarylacetoacetate hydrolase family protein [Candidatus Neomarinimicrobiota bacterium]|tara:strand:+ start:721 stop:1407 length:687 start_codon:yes stop_codon:yes gene_type:complete
MKWAFKPTGAIPWPVRDQDTFFPVNNLYCVGRNYRDHAIEMGGDPDPEPPFIFQKPPNALLKQGKTLRYPAGTSDLQYELELVVSLGKSGYNVEEADAENMIFGYGVGVDLTRRDLQSKEKNMGHPWFRGKVFFGSAALSEIVPKTDCPDVNDMKINLTVNEDLRQRAKCNDMIWSVMEIISFLSQEIPLAAGDLIYTGTPSGVGKLVQGDIVKANLNSLASLSFKVT